MECDSDSSAQRWISPALASGLVLGAVGLGLVLYTKQQNNNKGTKKKGKTDQSNGSFSSLYNTKPKPKASASANSPDSGKDNSDNNNITQDMKGYKTNSKGQKTTYFNRELSEKEKQLIGDITPKKIDGSAVPSSISNSPRPIPTSPQDTSGGSAWNKAGTWEEKNVTAWAADTLPTLLRSTVYDLPADADQLGKVSITSVQKIEGDATVSMIRGKKKYLYDLSTTVRWKLESGGTVVTGDLLIAEISADATHEFNVQGIEIASLGNHTNKKKTNEIVKMFIQSDTKGLKSRITSTLHSFYLDMKTKF